MYAVRTLLSLVLVAASSLPIRSQQQPVDTFGDPLPAQALHRFGTARLCTQGEVNSLAFCVDGSLLAAADRHGCVYVWETANGKTRIATEPGVGKRVAISPDGHWLAYGDDGPFEIRNLRKDEPPRLPLGPGTRAFAFSPDSKQIAVATADELAIAIYDIETGKRQRLYEGFEGDPVAFAFSPDGKRLALLGTPSADQQKEKEISTVRIVVWDVAKGNVIRKLNTPGKQPKQPMFLPDNKTLLVQISGRLVAWNVPLGERLDKIDHLIGTAYALDATGKKFATTDGPSVIDFASRELIHEFEATSLMRNLAMSADGRLLAACATRFDSASPRIMLWDLVTGKERTIDDAHRHYVDVAAFSHDGTTITTASHVEGRARVWDAKSAKQRFVLNIDSLAAKQSGGPRARRTLTDGLAYGLDGSELFISGQRWSLKTGEPIQLEADDDFRFDQTNSRRAVLSADGRFAGSFLNGNALLFWQPLTAKTLSRIEPDGKLKGEWFSLAFSHDGKQAATGMWFPPRLDVADEVLDPTVHVWDIAKGVRAKSLRHRTNPVACVMFAPDGETLAVVSFPTRLELWHLPSGRLLREMYLNDIEELPRMYAFPTLAFAPHGQWIAFTHEPGSIVIVETMTGKEIVRLKGHQGLISSLAFSPNSRRLLSGGRDTTALLWSVQPDDTTPKTWPSNEKLWDDLGDAPGSAYRIVWALAKHPEKALAVLSANLKGDIGAPDKEIRKLVEKLSSEKFAQRDAAIRRLKQIGTRAFPALEAALKSAPNLETTRRIEGLLRTVQSALTPETLRDLRGMMILELLATPEAARLFETLAKGDPGAAKTRLAQSALARMKMTK